MLSVRSLAVSSVLVLTLGACAADEGGGADDDGGGDDGGDGSADGYVALIEHDWTLPPGGNKYYCIRKTIEEDMYIGGFRAMAPPGVHHTLVSAGNPISEDGVYECEAGTHNFSQMIFESSSGEDPFELPEGLAAKVPAGAQINLNLHVLNAAEAEMSGTAGVEILPREEVGPESLATIVAMGPVTLELPPGEETVVTGQCTLPAGVTAFGVLPHMHGMGIHQKVVARSSIAGDTVLLDEDYDFDSNKRLYDVDPMVEIAAGDVVEVACTYRNTSDEPIYWGNDSYAAEMCSGVVYVFPAGDLASICGF